MSVTTLLFSVNIYLDEKDWKENSFAKCFATIIHILETWEFRGVWFQPTETHRAFCALMTY